MSNSVLSLKKSKDQLSEPTSEPIPVVPPSKDDWEVLERYLQHPLFGKLSTRDFIQKCLIKKVHPLLQFSAFQILSVSEVEELLQMGLNVNASTSKGLTPLINAMVGGESPIAGRIPLAPRIEYIEVLLKYGADCLAKASLPNQLGVTGTPRTAFEIALRYQNQCSHYAKDSWTVICNLLGSLTLKKTLDKAISKTTTISSSVRL